MRGLILGVITTINPEEEKKKRKIQKNHNLNLKENMKRQEQRAKQLTRKK